VIKNYRCYVHDVVFARQNNNATTKRHTVIKKNNIIVHNIKRSTKRLLSTNIIINENRTRLNHTYLTSGVFGIFFFIEYLSTFRSYLYIQYTDIILNRVLNLL